MNNQKQDQARLQQQDQQKVIINSYQVYNHNSHNLTGQVAPIASQQTPIQQNQQQQQLHQGQMFQNFQKNNKQFTSHLSGMNEFQQQQSQQQMLLQQQTQIQQPTQSSFAKSNQISAFSIKIIEGKLKNFSNSDDLKPLVQVQFGKRIWRTQVSKGKYPKWNEEKKFEIYGNKMYDLNNPSTICSSSATTQSSCSSISPQPQSNQQAQLFNQNQILTGQQSGVDQTVVDWNIEIVILHKSQDNEEVEIGRTNLLNVEEQQKQREDWLFIQNSSGVYGSVKIQFQFEYMNYQLQINKNSHQKFVNQKQQQKLQTNNLQYDLYKRIDDIQSSRPLQSHINSTSVISQSQTPQLNQNKRNPSTHTETSSFQDFQLIPQTTSRVASSIPQNYQDIQESVSKQQSYNSNYQGQNGSKMGFSFSQYDTAGLVSQLQQEKQENEHLMQEDRKLQERFNQMQINSNNLTKEQVKLQNNIKSQEGFIRQKQQGLEDQKDEFKQKLIRLEESKKLLQQYIQDYQNLISEEQEIMKGNQKLKSNIRMINEEEPQVQDTLNTLQKKNNSEILQLKIFKLRMINHLKEINSIFYNRKPTIPKIQGYEKGHIQRVKSQSNHISIGVDTITGYSVALKNIQLKVNNLTEIINNKNYEIESLREQIHQIQSNYDDQ